MKKFISLCFAFLILAGCNKPDGKYAWEKNHTFVIASVRPLETLSTSVSHEEIPALYICKKDGAEEWTIWWHYTSIQGLDEQYEEGYEYVIEVSEKMLADFPADAIPYVYNLEGIVSKVRKDSEGIPDEFVKEK